MAGLWLGWELSNEWVPGPVWWKTAPILVVVFGVCTVLSSGELSVLVGCSCSLGTGHFQSPRWPNLQMGLRTLTLHLCYLTFVCGPAENREAE